MVGGRLSWSSSNAVERKPCVGMVRVLGLEMVRKLERERERRNSGRGPLVGKRVFASRGEALQNERMGPQSQDPNNNKLSASWWWIEKEFFWERSGSV